MMVEQSRPGLPVVQRKYDCLSDQRFWSRGRHQYLAREPDRSTPGERDIRDRHEALAYHTGVPPEKAAVKTERNRRKRLRLSEDKSLRKEMSGGIC